MNEQASFVNNQVLTSYSTKQSFDQSVALTFEGNESDAEIFEV
jgi:hypothetical protein